jgi:pantoate--beta-alanine ligase
MTVALRTIPEAREWVQRQRLAGKTIGLVPTMGALHEGHLSLFRRARATCNQAAISIFVNPLQFTAGEDYDRYPRDRERDLKLAGQEGMDVAFCPEVSEMVPAPLETTVDPGRLAETLCGPFRPGHFRGVATVVAKLFHIMQPHRAFFGQKDAQQAVIIRKMVADLNIPVEIELCPTVREPDSLAMSSRNSYLIPEERANATVLYRALRHAEGLLRSGVRDASCLEQEMQRMIQAVSGAVLDYARVVDQDTLEDIRQVSGPVLAAVAVRFGKTRLIDNLILVPGSVGMSS